MNEYKIIATKEGCVINGNVHYCSTTMDSNEEDDKNKRILLALANEMGYEPCYLFDELAQSLMID